MMLLSPSAGPYFSWELVGWEILLAVISGRGRGNVLLACDLLRDGERCQGPNLDISPTEVGSQ